MDRYACIICGYVYNPEVGDEENGIASQTQFEELPDDRVCPICREGKEVFVSV
ncbi:MAG: rubredoxin [Methanospirillaceae archaeon]|nr:rubredoxin [Methanospirillaceae archaeon]